jgi:hypothetical protein
MADHVPAHEQTRSLTESVFYPEHQSRKASAEYREVHHRLVYELDEPCWICGVRNSTLKDPAQNPRGSTEMETHHWHVEWALTNSIDPALIITDFPALGAADDAHLRQWLDSEGNMLVLCDVCHRHGLYGIHSITYPAWQAQRWQRAGWDLAHGPAPAEGPA